MSTRNVCHRTSSSTTKQFHIHKNTNNKDICNTNNKLFMILYNCNFMMYCMRLHTDFCLGWGSECTSPHPFFGTYTTLMHIFAYESILHTDDQCSVLCTKWLSYDRNIMGYNIRLKINAS